MKINFITNRYSQQRQREKPVDIYPVLMAMQATYCRDQGHVVGWNAEGNYDRVVTEPETIPFDLLPAPDRVWTRAFDKRYQVYGNYKYHPATHMQVADGCWHGKCSFCVEKGRPYVVRPLEPILDEIRWCVELGFKEIFDDSGTFPDGEWLRVFCMAKIKYTPPVVLGCNMRIGADVDFKMMKAANFRMLLFGIESANQSTLDRLQKGIKADDIICTLRNASECGLEPHGAFMLGYPWESQEDEERTLQLAKYLLRKGYLKTAQVSIYNTNNEQGIDRGNRSRIYEAAYFPEFWVRRIRALRRWEDLLYLIKGVKKGLESYGNSEIKM